MLVENATSLQITFENGTVKDFRKGEFTIRKVSTSYISKSEKYEYYEVTAPIKTAVTKDKEEML